MSSFVKGSGGGKNYRKEVNAQVGHINSLENIIYGYSEIDLFTDTGMQLNENNENLQDLIDETEGINAEVTAQKNIVAELADKFKVIADFPAGVYSVNQNLQRNNAVLENIRDNAHMQGKYAWSKTQVTYGILETNETIELFGAATAYTSMAVTYGDSYSFDEETGLFTLEESGTSSSSTISGSVLRNAIKGKYIIQSLDSRGQSKTTGDVLIYIPEDATFSVAEYEFGDGTSGNVLKAADCTVYRYGATRTHEGYVTSDIEDEYPIYEDEVVDGYAYLPVRAVRGGIKYYEVDAEGYPTDVTFEINHNMNLGSSTTYNKMGTYFKRLKKAEIICDTLEAEHFGYVGSGRNEELKLKLKCKTVKNEALKHAFGQNAPIKIWISDVCDSIVDAGSWGAAPFTYCGTEENVFYCEPEAKKDGWGAKWNFVYNGAAGTTYYGITEEAFDAL